MIQALTTYINDDPTARAWLNGTNSGEPSVCNSAGVYQAGANGVCPAMVVNPAYKGISLPVDQWPLLSTWESTAYAANPQVQYCLQTSPEPFDTLLAAPLGNLEDVSESMQFHHANSTTTCKPDAPGVPNSLSAAGTQSVGQLLHARAHPPGRRRPLRPAGRVAPDDPRHLRGARATPRWRRPPTCSSPIPPAAPGPSPTTSSRRAPGRRRTRAPWSSTPPSPPAGCRATAAADYADLLTFAAGPGQTPGEGVGQLPPGYLPLTAADGLGGLAAYTLAAATDVAAQNGQVPPLTPRRDPGGRRPAGRERPPPRPSAAFGAAAFGGNGAFISALVRVVRQPAGQRARRRPRAKAAAAKAHAIKIGFIRLPTMADTVLWIRGLPVGFTLTLALLVALAALTTLFLGRRRRRW